MKRLIEFLNVKEYYQSDFAQGDSSSKYNVYRDIEPVERQHLDTMAMNKFGRAFVDCDYDEQGGLRSLYYQMKKDPKEIDQTEKEITKKENDETL